MDLINLIKMRLLYLFLSVGILFTTSCFRIKNTTTVSDKGVDTVDVRVVNKVYRSTDIPSYFVGTYTGVLVDSTKNVDFGGSLKLIKDSALLVIGSPGFGIEAFRLYANADSVVFLNRLERKAHIIKSTRNLNMVSYLQEVLFANYENLKKDSTLSLTKFINESSILADSSFKITYLELFKIGNLKNVAIKYGWTESGAIFCPKSYAIDLKSTQVSVIFEQFEFTSFSISPVSISNKYEIKYHEGL